MGTIYIDGKPYQADPRQNLLHACLSLGFDLPYFCWHAALGSVGACRQCAIKEFKDEEDTQGKLVMACMSPAKEGTRISIHDPEAVAFRAAIVEGMMLNHPHDCPVCDVGGECHLQDMTVMTGHDYRRTRFEKRTFRNQYLGPFVYHEMNRCIQCYRCVRFYREYAGGDDLNVFGIKNAVYFGRSEDGVLESEFAGNLVEICPTGVFTDATLRRHYTRKWDLEMAPSICVHCSAGCNISAGGRYGLLRRVLTRFNSAVNGYFLCDRGRFGYEYVNSELRIRGARLSGRPISRDEAERKLKTLVSGKTIGIGSPRASLEANFALRRLVGKERFFAGVADDQSRLVAAMVDILQTGPARSPSLHDIELCDAVLILGEDVTDSAPRMALSLRQSVLQQPLEIADKLHIPFWMDSAVREVVQDAKGPLFIAAPGATRLDDVATRTYRAAPEDVARLGFAVAHEIDSKAPEVSGLPAEIGELARIVAGALKSAKRPLIISGFSCRSESVVQSAANVAKALCDTGRPAALSLIAPECNSVGLALMKAGPLNEACELASSGQAKIDTLIVLENDLYRRMPAKQADKLLESAEHLVVLDHLATQTTAKAELLLPAGTFAESDGTLVSSEGRAQRFFSVFAQDADVRESWRWLGDPAWSTLDDALAAMAEALPQMAPAVAAAPSSKFRMAGAKIPRESHRYSGLTSIHANLSVVEPKPPDDPDSALAYSMEGSPNQPPGALQPFFWSPGWNSIQAVNKFQSEVGGPLRGGDPGVRLFEPKHGGTYFTEVPAPFARRKGEWLIVPLEHIFGSEELSLQAPGVASLAPGPYLAVNAADAASLQVGAPAGEVEIEIGGEKLRLPVEVLPDLPAGIAGIPAGLTPADGAAFPAWSRISRVS